MSYQLLELCSHMWYDGLVKNQEFGGLQKEAELSTLI